MLLVVRRNALRVINKEWEMGPLGMKLLLVLAVWRSVLAELHGSFDSLSDDKTSVR